MKKSVKDNKRRRGVMDLPKATEERVEEGRTERGSRHTYGNRRRRHHEEPVVSSAAVVAAKTAG
jgi:hypothetical protein